MIHIENKQTQEEYVYVLWGRIDPADGVWGYDGKTFSIKW